jgi:DNA repair exonuclease SbcCD ATPase subunit
MKSWIIIGILIALMSGAAYYYYSTTQSRIQAFAEKTATLEANNQRLIEVNQQNLDTIDELNESFAEVARNFEKIQSEFQSIRSQNSELRERLGRHNLGALAAAKPVLVERTINRASDSAARCFELLSGAPLTESERNAKSEREFNSECPWLWPGNN